MTGTQNSSNSFDEIFFEAKKMIIDDIFIPAQWGNVTLDVSEQDSMVNYTKTNLEETQELQTINE